MTREILVHLNVEVPERDPRSADEIADAILEASSVLSNGCEQALLLLERPRFENDPEARVLRAVLRSALADSVRDLTVSAPLAEDLS